jgi:hypothetical protein
MAVGKCRGTSPTDRRGDPRATGLRPAEPSAELTDISDLRHAACGGGEALVYDPISAAAGMNDYLADHPAGLIAVSSRLRDPLAHLALGSGAGDIVHTSSAPALVLPVPRTES